MKKQLTIFSLLFALSLSGCGSSEEETPATTTLPVKVFEQTLQTTTTTAATTAPPEVEEITELEQTDIDLENYENNFNDTIDLSLVNVNGVWLSIRNTTLETFIDKAEIKKNSWSVIANEDNEPFFLGNGYGVLADYSDDTSFEGTLLGIECYTSADKVLAKSVEDSLSDRYSIKAVVSSAENTKDDYEICYYNGIKTGMTYRDILIAFGEIEPDPEETSVSEEETSEETSIDDSISPEGTETSVTENAEAETSSQKKKKKATETAPPETNPEGSETVTAVTAEGEDTETSIEGESPEPTETTTTTVTTIPEPPCPEMTYYKNGNNTLMIFFKDGIVNKIYLYNNRT